MDIITEKEINRLKQEIQSKESALEAEKIVYAKSIKEHIGNDIMSELNNRTISTKNKKNSEDNRFRLFSLFKKIINIL